MPELCCPAYDCPTTRAFSPSHVAFEACRKGRNKGQFISNAIHCYLRDQSCVKAASFLYFLLGDCIPTWVIVHKESGRGRGCNFFHEWLDTSTYSRRLYPGRRCSKRAHTLELWEVTCNVLYEHGPRRTLFSAENSYNIQGLHCTALHTVACLDR